MIKNKDGTVFKLQGPNPLVKEQEWIPEEQFDLVNFNWKEMVFSDAIPKQSSPQSVVPKAVEITVEESREVTVPPPLPTPPPAASTNATGIKEENIVIMHCLPAVVSTNKDELYDESYSRTVYGNKFTLDSVVLERSDLAIIFWTKIKLDPNSIVYPSVYKSGIKFGEYRWWKVIRTEEKSGGFLTEAIFSDIHPEFSS
jgi:hypothetical protein